MTPKQIGFIKAAMNRGLSEKEAAELFGDTVLNDYPAQQTTQQAAHAGSGLGVGGAAIGGLGGGGLGALLGYASGKLSDDPTAAKRRAGQGAQIGGVLGGLGGAGVGGAASGALGSMMSEKDIIDYLNKHFHFN